MAEMDAKENDTQFMEIIREFPTVYNKRSKDFHDKRKKANCWKRIAELLETTTEEAERRYKTIRTAFTRYIAKQKGKSGSGSCDVGNLDPKYEHLRWLLTYINSRAGTSNLETRKNTSSSTSSGASITPSEDPDSAEELNIFNEENGTGCNNEQPEREIVKSGESLVVDGSLEAELAQLSPEGAESGSVSKKQKKGNYVSGTNWVGAKLSNKAQLKKTDDQIIHAMARLDKSLNFMQQQDAAFTKEMDEESLYCMSLVPRMRRLDPQKKAVIRNSIERVFMEVEYGSFTMPSTNTFSIPVGAASRQTYYEYGESSPTTYQPL